MSKWTKRAGALLSLAAAVPLLLAPSAQAAKACAGGQLPGGKTTTAEVLADQGITIKVHNHDWRGLALTIRDVRWNKALWKGIVAPGKDKQVKTDVFGAPPISYKIAFDVTSNVSNSYTYTISSARCY
ncbi:hypothetical protein ABZ863_14650 [Saccharomonospora sp. NPDC046836]|uniref:hypothetical protein n=1 Tax=Saccharomonospora sp. NPDC046836 TaxID=3156921 RepID=UPI0033DFD988